MPDLFSSENAYFYNMKLLAFILVLVAFWSCKQDNFKKVDAKDLAKEELKTINFKQVDRFPLFKTCDETASRSIQKNCFEQHLHQLLKPYIDTLVVDLPESDTLNLYLNINNKGKIKLDSISSKMNLTKTFQSIFENTPRIYPAQKRGIPVSVNLELPIILKVNTN